MTSKNRLLFTLLLICFSFATFQNKVALAKNYNVNTWVKPTIIFEEGKFFLSSMGSEPRTI